MGMRASRRRRDGAIAVQGAIFMSQDNPLDMPLVGIVMGSDSDWPTLKPAAEALREFGIAFEARVLSAHRTPDTAAEYARSASGRGLRVIVAAAGGAAHLAGAMAAHSELPVIGVPVAWGALAGLDALLSTIQMPPGVPVATVGIDAARNAGILAAQILATADPALREAVAKHKEKLAADAVAKDARLQEQLKQA
jgi:5-(carboxyamino)imidazole ribonucleotide mutase